MQRKSSLNIAVTYFMIGRFKTVFLDISYKNIQMPNKRHLYLTVYFHGIEFTTGK